MEKVASYKAIVRALVKELGKYDKPLPDWEVLTVIDDDGGHYLLVNSGWRGENRIYGNLLHLDVTAAGKVLVRCNGTEESVAAELVARGIPKESIILELQPSNKRPLTGYGVA